MEGGMEGSDIKDETNGIAFLCILLFSPFMTQ